MTKIKIGILQCDSVLPKFQAQFGDYPDMITKLLKMNNSKEINTEVFNVVHDQFPNANNDLDGYIISGSKAGVYDTLPWIQKLQAYIQELYRQKQKVVGICFGHQLVAKTFGARVEKSTNGWGVGVMNSRITYKKPWMNPEKETINLVVSHQDQVLTLPEGAQLLAQNSFCPISMFQFGDNILAMQGHPEFSTAYSAALMNERSALLNPQTLENGLKSLINITDETLIATWILQFIQH